MFRTIFSVALVGAANAVSLHKEKAAAPKDKFDVEEALAKAQSGDYTTEDVENMMEKIDHHMKGKDITDAIDWAADQGIGFDEVKAMIEGVEVSQAFDKHDIYDFAMDACCHFKVQPGDLDEMLHYAGKKLGITAEQGQELLETAGEVFDISQEEFEQAIEDCHAIGAKCAAKDEKKGDKKQKEKKEGKPEKKDGKKDAAKEKKLAQKGDWKLEDALDLDLESLTAEEVWDWLKENGEELKKRLHKRQKEVVAFVKKNMKKIEEFVAENKEELKDFAADLEKEAAKDGVKIDWKQLEKDAKDYFGDLKSKKASK